MEIAPIVASLRTLGVETVLAGEPLSRHSSFRIGGPAALFAEPATLEGVVRTLEWLQARQLPYFILGQGTNVLISDRGVDAVVISTARGLKDIAVADNRMVAGSGVLLARLAREAKRHGLGGLEFAVSIPGTLGGALVMNAGAHGSSMMAVVESVLVWDPVRGVQRIGAADVEFQYRQSRFMRQPWIALTADLLLTPRDPALIEGDMNRYMAHRKESQPLGEPNAGSIFKNPLPDYAGRLIESVGAKGWRVGDAEVSHRHANFIVNRGAATARDVLTLMRRVRCAVYAGTGIVLRPEVRWIGPGEGGAQATWDNLWYGAGEGLTAPCE